MENMFNPYWSVYKNLEDETIELTKYIQFDDNQTSVYSMRIADLLVRCAMEIEALSKELYWMNGGEKQFDNEGKERDLYFDTDCIKYINDLWGICQKKIFVSSTKFYFQKDENRILRPLHKAYKRGGTKWNKAYQAVKHDRKNSLKCGNIKNLIESLGALYILNVYYISSTIKIESTNTIQNHFDSRIGSELFSVLVVDATINIKLDGCRTDDVMSDEFKESMKQAIYVLKYTSESWENINLSFDKATEELMEQLMKSNEYKQYMISEQSQEIEDDWLSLATKFLGDDFITRHGLLKNFSMALMNAQKEAIIFKNQKIYG